MSTEIKKAPQRSSETEKQPAGVRAGRVEEVYEVPNPGRMDRSRLLEAEAPGSKSITNRALLIAAMAEGTSTLRGCLTSEDGRVFLDCLKALGFPVQDAPDGVPGRDLMITGFGGALPEKRADIYVGSAGTAARFLAAMLAFSGGEYSLRSSEQMKARPMQPLIDALRDAGARVECPEKEGHFPLRVAGVGDPALLPERLSVNIDRSSQFLSALLIALGSLRRQAVVEATGRHGLGYVDLTVEMMKSFGVSVRREPAGDRTLYCFSGGDRFVPRVYEIEPDMSAAAYFYAMGAVLGCGAAVRGVRRHMLQSDTRFLEVLEKMGCRLEDREDARGLLLTGPEGGRLKGGFSVDMSAFSDQALTLAAIAPYADSPVTITGIGHIRLQECDRIHAISHNLRRLGIRVEEKEDAVTVFPGKPTGGDVETFDDHRVAMSFALTGLRAEGVRILNPSCCRKTFAEYFEVLDRLLR